MPDLDPAAISIASQRRAFATASLILGISSYVHLLGLEKALLAIVFGWMALHGAPAARLLERRGWAIAGVALGALMLVIVPTVLLLNLDRAQALVDALQALQGGAR